MSQRTVRMFLLIVEACFMGRKEVGYVRLLTGESAQIRFRKG